MTPRGSTCSVTRRRPRSRPRPPPSVSLTCAPNPQPHAGTPPPLPPTDQERRAEVGPRPAAPLAFRKPDAGRDTHPRPSRDGSAQVYRESPTRPDHTRPGGGGGREGGEAPPHRANARSQPVPRQLCTGPRCEPSTCLRPGPYGSAFGTSSGPQASGRQAERAWGGGFRAAYAPRARHD